MEVRRWEVEVRNGSEEVGSEEVGSGSEKWK